MKHWPAILWVVFCGLVVLIATLAVVIFKVYTASNCLWIYAIWAVLLLGFITFKKYTSKDMHVHHYVLTGFIITFIGYQSDFLAIVHGVVNGIMTEGVSRWGVDPIWDYFVDTNGHWINSPSLQNKAK